MATAIPVTADDNDGRAEVCRDGFVVEGGVVVDVFPSGGPPPAAPPGDDSVAIISSSVGQF